MGKSKIKKTQKNIKPSRELDGDCYDMLVAMENGELEFETIPDHDKFIKSARLAAKNYFKKDERLSLRISSADLLNVKRMAASEGLPYQTYITSIIHKLTTGQLVVK